VKSLIAVLWIWTFHSLLDHYKALPLEYLRFAFGIHHNDVPGGLLTFGKKLTQQQIDDVHTRYALAKERLKILDLLD